MSKIIFIGLFIAIIAWFFYRSDQAKKAAKINIEEGQIFLSQNKHKEGITTTDSGLQFEFLHKGDGTEHPSSRSHVTVHYHGMLLDGTVFDSSVERGKTISFGLNQVITGWTEGLQLMTVGDKVRFYIPSSLAYGNRSAGKIMPGSTLIFDVELFSFK